MAKWEFLGQGIEFRRHATRKHGVKFDRYFRGRYTLAGKTYAVGFGWESRGWTLTKCLAALDDYRKNAEQGQGPRTRKEQKRAIEEQRQAEEAARLQEEAATITFSDLFEKHYMPVARADKKTWDRDLQLYRAWISPVIGSHRADTVSAFDIERVKKRALDAGKSPRTVQYILATVRHVFNFARQRRILQCENPVLYVKVPTPNNRRVRFLSPEEAETLLFKLRERSEVLYQMAMMSLYCGLRFSEIAALTWADVDIGNGSLFVRDPKNKHSRTTFMPERIHAMLSAMQNGLAGNNNLVFPGRGTGTVKLAVSKVFARAVDDMGLNAGITDRRQKLVFHSLRHTFGSWLAMEGVPMVTLKELLGHQSLQMTERYSHLAPHSLKAAVAILDRQYGPEEAGMERQ
jgi:integrase